MIRSGRHLYENETVGGKRYLIIVWYKRKWMEYGWIKVYDLLLEKFVKEKKVRNTFFYVANYK